jgi:hypothetical protein
MPIRGSPNGAGYLRPQAGRDCPESVVAINRNGWSQSIGMAGRDRPVRAVRGDAPRLVVSKDIGVRAEKQCSSETRTHPHLIFLAKDRCTQESPDHTVYVILRHGEIDRKCRRGQDRVQRADGGGEARLRSGIQTRILKL